MAEVLLTFLMLGAVCLVAEGGYWIIARCRRWYRRWRIGKETRRWNEKDVSRVVGPW